MTSSFLIPQMLSIQLKKRQWCSQKVTCIMWYVCGLIAPITHRITSDSEDGQKAEDVGPKLSGEISQ